MNTDEPRIRYAVDVLGQLFPGTAARSTPGRDSADVGRTFALAPSSRRPRLLVPITPRDAAATAVGAYGGRLTRQARWSYVAVARGLAAAGPAPLRSRLTAVSDSTTPAAGIDDHLSHALERRVAIAVHLTPDRANRKPIVQALAAGERHPLAFAKVGTGPLTSRLVNQEAHSLRLLADRKLDHLRVPTVVHHGEFAGHPVLTMKPLPTWQRGASPTITDIAAATREVASTVDGGQGSLQDSNYWLDVLHQLDLLPTTARAQRLRGCAEQMTTLLGNRELSFGASHGDWTPWNMWLTERELLVWDWERYSTQTPDGFDLLHFRLNEALVKDPGNRADAAYRLIADASDVLAITGGGSQEPLATVLLYLLHIGLRYESDDQTRAGAAVGNLETWLLPAVEGALGSLTMVKHT